MSVRVDHIKVAVAVIDQLGPALKRASRAMDSLLKQYSLTYRTGYRIVNHRGRNRLVRMRR